MPCLDHDPEHLLGQAKAARDLAYVITDPMARAAMLDVAASYQRMAERAEARIKISQGLALRTGSSGLADATGSPTTSGVEPKEACRVETEGSRECA